MRREIAGIAAVALASTVALGPYRPASATATAAPATTGTAPAGAGAAGPAGAMPGVAGRAGIRSATPDIRVANLRTHLRRLQEIADRNRGTRAHGTPGYLASIMYVKGRLDAAGFHTRIQPFRHAGTTGYNLVADWPGGDPGEVLFLGSHLDSVAAGPGINDNGSGSATVLEIALRVAALRPRTQRHLRFGWWGAEELGLAGSAHYVRSLPAAEVGKIKTYLNLDMTGSPNYGLFVYDDDAAIRRTFQRSFARIGLRTEPINQAGRSDHASFHARGVRVGGLFTGAEKTKTPAQAAKWGGQAGVPFDRCYHSRCDTLANLNSAGLNHVADVSARVSWKLAGAR